jgi:hydroxyacylglutathione hydrolase
MRLEIEQINCLSDNYGYLVHDPESGETACIDTPETAPILDRLQQKGWQLSYIWNTHHHFDHAGNNLEIKQATGCTIIGPAGEADKIPGLDRAVDQGDSVELGAHEAQVLNVGGHTLGHIAYYLPATDNAFVGDALFALGCGRVFEGTMGQMYSSLAETRRLAIRNSGLLRP